MFMFVLVCFGQVQIKADSHQDARADQSRGDFLMKHAYRENCTDERGR